MTPSVRYLRRASVALAGHSSCCAFGPCSGECHELVRRDGSDGLWETEHGRQCGPCLYYDSLDSDVSAAFDWARTNVVDPTDINTWNDSLSSYTDVVDLDRHYTGSFCGLAWYSSSNPFGDRWIRILSQPLGHPMRALQHLRQQLLRGRLHLDAAGLPEGLAVLRQSRLESPEC